MKPSIAFKIILAPSKDIPGQWIAHCLDLDLVTQGNSARHAFNMACEAISLIMGDDLKRGLNQLERRKAPEEYWN